MRTFIILLPLLCFVNGRNLHDFNEEQHDGNEDQYLVKNIRDSSNQMRHRRKSRQSFYDFSPYYYDSRRDYVRHQDDTLNQIVKLLDEISVYVKRPASPPPQPQIVYVPYPMPYPVLQYRPCAQKPNKVNLTVRWPEMEDDNMNWGLSPAKEDDTDDGDGSRDISFDPVEPSDPMPSPPPVEHGSQQAGMDHTTRAPATTKPGICKAAIIICCNLGTKQDQQNCFLKYGCPKTYSTGLSCKPKTIQDTLDEFAKAYAPNNMR